MVVSQQISPSALRSYKLSKYANGQPGKMLLEAKRVKRVTSQFMSKSGAKEAAKRMKALKKTASGAKKVADTAKKVQDAFFKKMPGGGTPGNAGIAGGQLLNIVIQGGLAAAVIQNTLIQNFINDRVDDQFNNLNNDLSKNLTLLTTLNSRMKNLDTRVNDFDKRISRELDANAKDYAQLSKQSETIAKNAADAKKQSNDALYETREGRKIVEGKVGEAKKQANDALYETRASKQNLEAQVTGLRTTFDTKIQAISAQISNFTSRAGDTFQNAINSTIAKIQNSLTSTQAQVTATQAQVTAIKQAPVDTNAIVSRAVAEARTVSRAEIAPVQAQATAAQATAAAAMQQIATAIPTLTAAIPNLTSAVQAATAGVAKAEGKADLALAASNANKTEAQKLEESFKKQVEENNKGLQTRDLSQSKLSQEFDKRLAEISNDFDAASKISQGNATLAEQRWQETLAMNQKWLDQSYGTEKVTATFQLSVLPSLLRDVNLTIEDKTSRASNSVKTDLQKQINDSENKINNKIDKLETTSNKSIDTITKELEQQRNNFERVANENAQIAQGDIKLAEQKWNNTVKELEKTFDRKQNDSEERLGDRIDQETFNRKREDKQITSLLGAKINDIQQQVDSPTTVTPQIERIRRDLEKVKQDLTTIKPSINDLNKRTKEQEKVNKQALPKLDQIVGILGLIPARAANAIRPSIPTIPQIETAAATGTCRTTQPGGCMNKALKDNAADITNNNNTNAANILDAVNTGANAALLQGQQTILARLGDQLPGGIGGKLSRFADWMHLDRVLNILIFAATVHNALMLSNDIGQTLLGAINNVLTLIGLKKEDGSSFDLGSVISGSIENLIKGAIGSDNYTSLKEAWAKANRIYQATTNLLNSFLNLSQTILQASELIAAYTGKIGNALKKGGVILESAYGWMNPQPKFNRVTQTLESLQNGASTIQMVTQAPLDVVNAVTESTTAAIEFVKAVKEDDKPVNKAAPIPEPDELKAKESQSKTDSQPLDFDFSDLFDGED